MFYFISYFNNYVFIICKRDLVVYVFAKYIYIYTPSEVQPEDGSIKPKDVVVTCIFTTLILNSCVSLYYY